MFDNHSTMSAQQLPVTLRARYPWFVWPSMAMMAVIGIIPLWAATYLPTASGSGGPAVIEPAYLLTIAMGLFLLAFPVLLIVSVFKGFPLLHVDEGVVHHISIFGRKQVIRLSDYAEVSLGEAVLAKGYQPRLEAAPMRPGEKLRMLPLRPFVHTRTEAEALVALIRHAAGERPKPSATQAAQLQSHGRREWLTLGAVIAGAVILLILLRWSA